MSRRVFTEAWLDAHRVDLEAVDESQIVGIGHVLAEVRSLVGRLADPALLAEVGGSLPRGILLWGDPGVGKSLTARHLATLLSSLAPRVSTYELHVDELSPARVRGTFRHLATRDDPSVVIVDEIDQASTARRSLVPERQDRELLTAFLSALDGLTPAQRVVLVATTTYAPSYHDAALTRPGRIGHHVHVTMPSLAEIHELWARFTARVRVEGELDLAWAAARTDGSTPAEIRGYVDDAVGLAIADGRRAIRQEDLRIAIARDGAVEPAPEPIPVSQRVAIHEASHCGALVALLGKDAVASARVDAMAGRTEMRAAADVAAAALPLVDRLALLYAGLAGERLLLGSGGPGSEHDVRRVTEVLLDAFEQAGDPALPPLSPSVMESMLPDAWRVRAATSMGERASDAMARAEALVAANEDGIRRLAARLIEEPRLEGAPLREAVDAAAFRDPARPMPAALADRLPN